MHGASKAPVDPLLILLIVFHHSSLLPLPPLCPDALPLLLLPLWRCPPPPRSSGPSRPPATQMMMGA